MRVASLKPRALVASSTLPYPSAVAMLVIRTCDPIVPKLGTEPANQPVPAIKLSWNNFNLTGRVSHFLKVRS